jgi:tRNA (guanosine-2'-O-)-methyltransferase
LRQVLDRRQPDLTLVTDFVHKQRNLSALVRVADAAGIMGVHAVLGDNEYKAFRGTAMGSHHWVQVNQHDTIEDALAEAHAADGQIVAAHLGDSARDYRDVDYTRPTVLLLGAERRGVSEAGVALADCSVHIPMLGMVGSLNVSVAAGVILAEAQQQRLKAGLYDQRRIDEATYERLFFEWGHPKVREFCLQRGLRYPPLNAEGEIDDPSAWYASVLAGTAPRTESSNE